MNQWRYEIVHTICFHLYEVKEWGRLIYEDRDQNSSCSGRKRGKTGKGHKGPFLGDMAVLYILIEVLLELVYTFAKIHQNVYLGSVFMDAVKSENWMCGHPLKSVLHWRIIT